MYHIALNDRAARVAIVIYAVKVSSVGVILYGWYMYHFGVCAVSYN